MRLSCANFRCWRPNKERQSAPWLRIGWSKSYESAKLTTVPGSAPWPGCATGLICDGRVLARAMNFMNDEPLAKLSELQPFELDAVGANAGQVVMRLLRKPGGGAAAKNFRQAHGHFGRNSALLVDQ